MQRMIRHSKVYIGRQKYSIWVILSFLAVVLIYTWGVSTRVDDIEEDHLGRIKVIDEKYDGQLDYTEKKLEEARKERDILRIKYLELENRFQYQERKSNTFREMYYQSLEDNKKIENEKDYIPDATTQQQLDYLSNYRYEEY